MLSSIIFSVFSFIIVRSLINLNIFILRIIFYQNYINFARWRHCVTLQKRGFRKKKEEWKSVHQKNAILFFMNHKLYWNKQTQNVTRWEKFVSIKWHKLPSTFFQLWTPQDYSKLLCPLSMIALCKWTILIY